MLNEKILNFNFNLNFKFKKLLRQLKILNLKP